jgi:hypothetical protein
MNENRALVPLLDRKLVCIRRSDISGPRELSGRDILAVRCNHNFYGDLQLREMKGALFDAYA